MQVLLDTFAKAFDQVPNGAPRTLDESSLLVCLASVRDDSVHPSVVSAKVQMARLGFDQPIQLTDAERRALYRYVAFRTLGATRSTFSQLAKVTTAPEARQMKDRCIAFHRKVLERYAYVQKLAAAVAVDLAPRLPPGLSLRPHQLEGVGLAREKGFRFVFLDDMGLGKTIQMLACAHLLGPEAFPLLICAPVSMLGVWRRAVATWLEPTVPLQVVRLQGGVDLLREKASADAKGLGLVVLASWAQLALHVGPIRALRAGMFFGDESHYLSSWEANRTKAAMQVRSSFRHVLLSTGTFMPNGRHKEAYGQIKMVAPKAFAHLAMLTDEDRLAGASDRLPFLRRFCDPTTLFLGSGNVTSYDGSSHPVEFGSILAGFSIRRTKAQVFGPNFPRKTRVVLPIDLGSRAQLQLARSKDQARARVQRRADEVRAEQLAKGMPFEVAATKAKRILMSEAVSMLAALWLETGLIKADFVVERVVDLLESGEKTIVFVWHDEVLERVAAGLRKAKVSVLVGSGSFSTAKRAKVIEAAERGEADVVVLSSAYREGLTLTRYSRLILCERWWIPGWEVQAEDRIYREGQTRDVSIEIPFIEGSCDEIFMARHTQKETHQGQVQGHLGLRTYQWITGAPVSESSESDLDTAADQDDP